MLNTNAFLDQLIEQGYRYLCIVPCSFAKHLVNAVINHEKIEYLPCASEAVACSVAAGLKLAGEKPLVVAQSSGLTNMGSCLTSLLNPYALYFPIIVSWRTYKTGDSEIQHKHLATQLPALTAAYGYEHVLLDKNSEEKAVGQVVAAEQKKQICILEKETFTEVPLEEKHQLDLSAYLPRSHYLKHLHARFKGSDTFFIGTTGNTARELYRFMPHTNNFYMAGNMGGALSVGLGVAKTGRRVVVCGGDAEFVMHLGGLTTAGRYPDLPLTYIVFDNQANKSTGGQNTYQTHLHYAEVAKNAGFQTASQPITTLAAFANALQEKTKLNFLWVKCSFDAEAPRPPYR